MDVEIYNYFDIILREYVNGRLTYDNLQKERKRLIEEDLTQASQKSGQMKLNAGVVYITNSQAPVGHSSNFIQVKGYQLQRDNIDVMNNYYINISSRAFTNIEDILENQRDNIELQKQKETLTELEKVRDAWSNEILDEVNQQYERLDKVI